MAELSSTPELKKLSRDDSLSGKSKEDPYLVDEKVVSEDDPDDVSDKVIQHAEDVAVEVCPGPTTPYPRCSLFWLDYIRRRRPHPSCLHLPLYIPWHWSERFHFR